MSLLVLNPDVFKFASAWLMVRNDKIQNPTDAQAWVDFFHINITTARRAGFQVKDGVLRNFATTRLDCETYIFIYCNFANSYGSRVLQDESDIIL